MSRKAPEQQEAEPVAGGDAVERVLAALSLAAAPIEPPPGLWERIAGELGATAAKEGAVSRLDQGKWRRIAPGIQMKPLWGKRTFLLRCEPGAVLPRHRHRAFEHTLILAGDIVTSEGVFGPGDYQGVPEGWHEAWSTRTGCLALVQYDP